MFITTLLAIKKKENEKSQVILYQRGGKFWFGTEVFTWILKLISTQRNLILRDGQYV